MSRNAAGFAKYNYKTKVNTFHRIKCCSKSLLFEG